MKSWLFILLASLTLLSCDPVKRHARLVKKFPHVHTPDTIVKRDTVRIEVPKVSVDTVFHESLLRDKFSYLYKNNNEFLEGINIMTQKKHNVNRNYLKSRLTWKKYTKKTFN